MSHRKFTDSVGRIWDVWSVIPDVPERRSPVSEPLDDDVVERRVGIGKLPLPAPLAAGWLTFETAHERRRLAPIPADWEKADPETLQGWCGTANPAASVRRILG